MKKTIAFISILFIFSCSNEVSDELDSVNAKKDIPTPKSKVTNANPNEVLAPQTCYYGCKARK